MVVLLVVLLGEGSAEKLREDEVGSWPIRVLLLQMDGRRDLHIRRAAVR